MCFKLSVITLLFAKGVKHNLSPFLTAQYILYGISALPTSQSDSREKSTGAGLLFVFVLIMTTQQPMGHGDIIEDTRHFMINAPPFCSCK